MQYRIFAILPLLISLSACAQPRFSGPQAVSLLGTKLFPPELAEATRAEYKDKLEVARRDHERAPGDADAWIWYGRRTAYLGRYLEAIQIYTEGAEAFPEDPRFLRHRGHRYISLRRFEDAVVDLARAAKLATRMEDQVEPDGMPNALGIPTSTLKTNIFYHLGLALYLLHDFEQAEVAYLECLRFSKNPDMESATRYWLYLTRMRLGEPFDAYEVLEPVTAEWDVIENTSYHRLLLAFKDDIDIATLEKGLDSAEDTPSSASLAYGVACFHRFAGNLQEAHTRLEQIVSQDGWASFGFIAAEVEVAQIRRALEWADSMRTAAQTPASRTRTSNDPRALFHTA